MEGQTHSPTRYMKMCIKTNFTSVPTTALPVGVESHFRFTRGKYQLKHMQEKADIQDVEGTRCLFFCVLVKQALDHDALTC